MWSSSGMSKSCAGMVLLYNQLVARRAVWGTDPAVPLLIPKISSEHFGLEKGKTSMYFI